jgi:hypothetical protein
MRERNHETIVIRIEPMMALPQLST